MKRHYQSAEVPRGGGKRKCNQNDQNILSDAPREVRIVDYAESRAQEIEALSKCIESKGGLRTISQKLPRHMRRRAMGHNIKRLPRRLREAAQIEFEKNEKKSTNKRPSRKHRRRPKHLLSDYQRRQRNHIWLETHIWHAKRFKMVDKWGYRLPLHPNDKSVRACYRAVANHCLLQDISFLCCIEVKGPQKDILDSLSHLMNDDTGPTIAGKAFLTGARCGQTVLYSCDQYPRKAVGQVSFLWRPSHADEVSEGASEKQLWIWCHPSCFDQMWKELQRGFKITAEIERMNETLEKDISSEEMSVKKSRSDSHVCNIGTIVMKSLKDALTRFRLTGPMSHTVLKESLVSSDIRSAPITGSVWWQEVYSDDHALKTHEKQRDTWKVLKSCQSPGEIPPNQVLALTVKDPRLFLPKKRTKVTQTDQGAVTCNPLYSYLVPSLADSPLWEEDVQTKVKSSKMSEHELNMRRSNCLVPGTYLELGEEESQVPIILIQRPGIRISSFEGKNKLAARSQHCLGFGSGWDIIAPPGWAMTFLLAFVFRGARVGGLREAKCIASEMSEMYFPDNFPDTEAGRMEAEEHQVQLQGKYDRNPPAKRPNYVKLGIKTPFVCPWKELIREWCRLPNFPGNPDSIPLSVDGSMGPQSLESSILPSLESSVLHSVKENQFYVLRNRKQLKMIHTYLSLNARGQCLKQKSRDCVAESDSMTEDFLQIIKENTSAIIPVRIVMHAQGVPSKFGHICIPSHEDFDQLIINSQYGGPLEPSKPDHGAAKRKEERKQRQKRKRQKKKKKIASVKEKEGLYVENQMEVGTENSVAKNTEHLNLLESTSRPIIGFVSDGDFALAEGRGMGIGYCALIGLWKLLTETPKEKPGSVLVRGTSTLQYRFAQLSVIL